MATAREIMTGGAQCAQVHESVAEAAAKMRDLQVGALPICGEDNRLKGMITDRDIAVECVATGKDPSSTTVEEFVVDETVTIGADDSLEDALRTMTSHGVRRLPVIDGHELVGMLSQADIARHCPDDQIASLVELISAARPNN